MLHITDKEVYSDSGYVHRIGTDNYFKRGTLIAGDTAESFEEANAIPEPEDTQYGERVNDLIRQRYSLSEELSILRQRDSKPAEFSEYYAYAEACKAKAKEVEQS